MSDGRDELLQKQQEEIQRLKRELKEASRPSSLFATLKRSVKRNIHEFFDREDKMKSMDAELKELRKKLEEKEEKVAQQDAIITVGLNDATLPQTPEEALRKFFEPCDIETYLRSAATDDIDTPQKPADDMIHVQTIDQPQTGQGHGQPVRDDKPNQDDQSNQSDQSNQDGQPVQDDQDDDHVHSDRCPAQVQVQSQKPVQNNISKKDLPYRGQRKIKNDGNNSKPDIYMGFVEEPVVAPPPVSAASVFDDDFDDDLI